MERVDIAPLESVQGAINVILLFAALPEVIPIVVGAPLSVSVRVIWTVFVSQSPAELQALTPKAYGNSSPRPVIVAEVPLLMVNFGALAHVTEAPGVPKILND